MGLVIGGWSCLAAVVVVALRWTDEDRARARAHRRNRADLRAALKGPR
jgi:hypothetical protein